MSDAFLGLFDAIAAPLAVLVALQVAAWAARRWLRRLEADYERRFPGSCPYCHSGDCDKHPTARKARRAKR